MNLFKLLITILCFRCQASFLNSVHFKYYKAPRLVGKNHSTYVNTPEYLRNKKNKIDKITTYSHPIEHCKKRRTVMVTGDPRINNRIVLGTIYTLIVMYMSKIDPPDPPDEPPHRRPKYDVFKKPIWAPINSSLTDEQSDTLYKVCLFSWSIFLFYFVNLKF
tara:strand:- start:622 stop:1107 length:486 start_codon:yes stop_codon:yes gene_type:complete